MVAELKEEGRPQAPRAPRSGCSNGAVAPSGPQADLWALFCIPEAAKSELGGRGVCGASKETVLCWKLL